MIWEENEEENVEKQEKVVKGGKYAYESESSEDEKRKVKTPKEKLMDLIKSSYTKIRDAIDNKNFVEVFNSYDELMKNADKIKALFGENIPTLFIRTLYLTEEGLNLPKDEQKKLAPKNNTAFNNLKKSFSKTAKRFEEDIVKYKETKESEEDLLREEQEREESEKLSDMDDLSLSDVSDVDIRKDDDQDPAVRRLKWVKKPGTEIKKEKISKEKDKDKEREKEVKKKKDKIEKQTEKVEVLTDEKIDQEADEITNQRGHLQRPIEIVARLDYLLSNTQNVLLKIKLLNLYILICFDTSPGQFSALSPETWNKIHDCIILLINTYQGLGEEKEENAKIGSLEKRPKLTRESISFIVRGSLVSILEKLELELYKALQFTDQNSSEYISRVRDELKFLTLCHQIEDFYLKFNDHLSIARIYSLVMQHIYYKNEESVKKMLTKFNLELDSNEYIVKSISNPEELITHLSETIYKYSDEKSKIKMMLCKIYFLSVHNKYSLARNLFQSSQLFEVVELFRDDQLKVLYNRTLAQLGLSAFREGKYQESLFYLEPLCNNGTSKLKEYLSQSYNKEAEKSIFFDKDDKKRVIPYIMTISIDEIECSYYLSLMITDLPNILLYKLGRKYNRYNPFYKKILENYEKQIFNGPPETNKESILCASAYMAKGEWTKCNEIVMQLKTYNHYANNKDIKTNLTKYIIETSLKCYLIFYSVEFRSFNLNSLSNRFSIEKKDLRRIINKMILESSIEAKWSGEVLSMNTKDNNARLLKNLSENLDVITEQNLNLIQIAAKIK